MQSYSVVFEIDPRRARTRSLKATKNSPADASTGVIFISPARVILISPKGVSPACPKGSNARAFSTSDIIESDFGIYKAKKSPNKLYGITSLVLILPLYPKTIDYSVAKKQYFKERLANVKLKDVDLWAKENLPENRVAIRSKTLNKAS